MRLLPSVHELLLGIKMHMALGCMHSMALTLILNLVLILTRWPWRSSACTATGSSTGISSRRLELGLGLALTLTLTLARFVYRDLKSENVLVASDGHLKLADFGTAKRLPEVKVVLWCWCWW